MTDKPKFSVITPTYNCREFILRSYQCLLNQIETNWEWIIVDDGSADNSLEVLSTISDGRVTVYSYQPNKGRGHARNYALGKVTGDIVVVWDIDDLYFPSRLSVINEAMSKGYDYFCSYALVIDLDFNVKGGRYFGQGNFGLPKMFPHPTLAFNANLLETIKYGENMVAGEDLNVMIHLSQKFNGCYYKDFLMLYMEDREVSLLKTLDMQQNHEKSVKQLLDNKIINLTWFRKIKLLLSLKMKTLVLKSMLIYPEIYMKTVKYRYLESIDDKFLNNEALAFIDKFKGNER